MHRFTGEPGLGHGEVGLALMAPRTGQGNPALAADEGVCGAQLSCSSQLLLPGCPGAGPLRGGRGLSISMGAPPGQGIRTPLRRELSTWGWGGF